MTFPDFDDLWSTYCEPNIGKREATQFRAACANPQTAFLDTIIKPQAYVPDAGYYMPVDYKVDRAGRDEQIVANIMAGKLPWENQGYFANALKLVPRDDPTFNHPKDRVAMAPHYVITLEFDDPNPVFFRQQMAWLRSPNNKLDSPIGQFVRKLSVNRDFVGLCVPYSGSKSLHFHFVFSTHLIAERCGPEPTSLRYGLEQAWEKMSKLFVEEFNPPVPPDRSIRMPESYKRLPNSYRITGEGHIMGIPADTIIPQVTLWEHIPTRTPPQPPGTAPISFFDMPNFTNATPMRSRNSKSVPPTFIPGSPFMTFCDAKMLEYFPGDTDGQNIWPKFGGFTTKGVEWEARFFKMEVQPFPNWVMGTGFSTVMTMGLNPKCLTNDANDPTMVLMPRLPAPLGEMLARWDTEFHSSPSRLRTPEEQQFADASTSYDAARLAMGRLLNDVITRTGDGRQTFMVTAPEGITKTTSLFK